MNFGERSGAEDAIRSGVDVTTMEDAATVSKESAGINAASSQTGQDTASSAAAAPTEASITTSVDRVVRAKSAVHAQMKIVCRDIERLQKVSIEYSKDVRRLELEIESMPVLEDWIRMTVSEIAQLKSQIKFMHNIIDN